MSEVPIIALIPAWNEATRIGPVVEATRAHLQVLVVDDGSHDGTPAVAEAAGATVVRHSRNRGKGVALMDGFTWALERDYEAVLTLDADGQHDPADIPKFLAAYEAGAGDLIVGRRDFSQMPFPRSFVNPFGSWLLSLALGTRIYDNQSGYRLYDSRLLERLDLSTTGFELEVEVIIQAVCKGMCIGWLDIRTIYGIDKVSYFHPIKDSARFLGMVWHARKQRVSRPGRGHHIRASGRRSG
ncbi:MAG: glycosyltransferase family 2 protein [Anaerolineae bacterium]|nr:glycosyltransferase family 2 protein [Anaerolineae bacterium]